MIVKSGAFTKFEVSTCLKSYCRCRKDRINRNVSEVPSESGGRRKIIIELEQNFSHAESRKSLIYIAIAHIAVCIEHYYHLFAAPNPFGDFSLKIGEKSLSRATIVVLIVEMIHVLTVRALRPIREAGTIRIDDLEKHRRTALIPRPGPATESGGVSAAA